MSARPSARGRSATNDFVLSDDSGASFLSASHSVDFYDDMNATLSVGPVPPADMSAEMDEAPDADATAGAVHPSEHPASPPGSDSSGEASSGSVPAESEVPWVVKMYASTVRGDKIALPSLVSLPLVDSYTAMELFNALKRNHSLLRKYTLNAVTLKGRKGRYRLSHAALILSCPFFSTAHKVTEVMFQVNRNPAFPTDGWTRKKKKNTKSRMKRKAGIEKVYRKTGEWEVDAVWEYRNLGQGTGYEFLTEWKETEKAIWSAGSGFYDGDGTVTESLKKYYDTVPELTGSDSFIEWQDATIAACRARAEGNQEQESSE